MLSGGSSDEVLAVSIYFPYSDLYTNSSYNNSPKLVSLASASADADEGIGEVPIYDVNDNFMKYEKVLIDDEYTFSKPTHIIGINGTNLNVVAPLNAFPPSGPIRVGLSRPVLQVYVGSVRINKKHQFDALLSLTGNGGGSEIIFTRSDGFLKVSDGQVQSDNFRTPLKSISRYDIRNGNWVNYSFEWDMDWEENNFNQGLAIYEEDNRNTSEIGGKITTTVKMTDGISTNVDLISWKVVYKSDDAIINQIEINREVFLVNNRVILPPAESYQGWPVRDVNAYVSWTLNDRTLY